MEKFWKVKYSCGTRHVIHTKDPKNLSEIISKTKTTKIIENISEISIIEFLQFTYGQFSDTDESLKRNITSTSPFV